MGMNEFGDLNIDEFSRKFNGLQPDKRSEKRFFFEINDEYLIELEQKRLILSKYI